MCSAAILRHSKSDVMITSDEVNIAATLILLVCQLVHIYQYCNCNTGYRQIGKMLNAREPKIVNGPEVLDKYVGETEANIRKLFADAEEEQARVR